MFCLQSPVNGWSDGVSAERRSLLICATSASYFPLCILSLSLCLCRCSCPPLAEERAKRCWMAAELVNSATSDKLKEVDWVKNIEICELVARDQRQARDVVKAIKKRLGSKSPQTQLYAVMLLEMLMNNIGEHIHGLVIDNGVLPILVKIVKKKSDFPVRERIFLLLDATQTSLGGASGKFPQYYSAYYDLVSSGVQFPERTREAPPSQSPSQASKKNTLNGELATSKPKVVAQKPESQHASESSIIQKASNALEVLKEVLDAVDSQNPEGAKDEFTLDLVEQCSFQKQRVMHLVMTSREEKVVSRAIDLNEQLQKVLARHDAILSGRPLAADRSEASDRSTATANHNNHEDTEEEEDEAEQLFRRIRKGKACARPEDEKKHEERLPVGLLGSSIPSERLNRPIIRPVDSEQSHELSSYNRPFVWPFGSEQSYEHPAHNASHMQPLQSEQLHEPDMNPTPVAIPPPPAKHIERERFFQEKKADSSTLTGHMRGLSLHSRNTSSSCSGNLDLSD